MVKFPRSPEIVTVQGKRVIIPGNLYYRLMVKAELIYLQHGKLIPLSEMIDDLPWYEREEIKEVQDNG